MSNNNNSQLTPLHPRRKHRFCNGNGCTDKNKHVMLVSMFLAGLPLCNVQDRLLRSWGDHVSHVVKSTDFGSGDYIAYS
ncbi:hypothetical protein MBANPS3_012410 [Mucor bainieri]